MEKHPSETLDGGSDSQPRLRLVLEPAPAGPAELSTGPKPSN